MSINHEHLRRLVKEMEQGVAATTSYTWLDLAQEVVRLRTGVERLLEMCLLERDAAFQDSPMRAGEVAAFNLCAERLTDLLAGDHDE